jgi:hypothetical protein
MSSRLAAAPCFRSHASLRIAVLRATIAKPGRPIAILCRSQPCRGALVARHRHSVAVTARTLARLGGPEMDGLVAPGRKLVIGGELILVRASLVALTRRLVAINA